MGISIPPNGMASVNFGFQGLNMATASGVSSPVYGSASAAPNTGILAGAAGSLSLAGAPSALITGVDFSVNNNLNSAPVIGSDFVPEIFYGRIVVNGNLTAYFEDLTVLNYFLNETEVALSIQLDDANGTDFMAFTFGRVKLMGGNKTVGPDGGVIFQAPFQALLKSGTGYDTGSLVIQRSNA